MQAQPPRRPVGGGDDVHVLQAGSAGQSGGQPVDALVTPRRARRAQNRQVEGPPCRSLPYPVADVLDAQVEQQRGVGIVEVVQSA